MIVRMWEVRARPEGVSELLSWLCDIAIPAVEMSPLHISSEVYSSADNRVVVISKWRSDPEEFLDPPSHLTARSPHYWDFTQVDR